MRRFKCSILDDVVACGADEVILWLEENGEEIISANRGSCAQAFMKDKFLDGPTEFYSLNGECDLIIMDGMKKLHFISMFWDDVPHMTSMLTDSPWA